jgi:thiamine biosynthesis lipoprotein
MAVGTKPGGAPWRIGVVDPAQPGSYFAVVELEDMAMGTSGGYQRYFEQDGETYWHILDPDTAAPARSGLASVTVVSPSAFLCDGLSTALFVMGLEEGAQLWRDHPELEFEAIFVTEKGEIYRTAGLEDRFSLAEGYEGREVVVLE